MILFAGLLTLTFSFVCPSHNSLAVLNLQASCSFSCQIFISNRMFFASGQGGLVTQKYPIILSCILRVSLTTEAAATAGRKDKYSLLNGRKKKSTLIFKPCLVEWNFEQHNEFAASRTCPDINSLLHNFILIYVISQYFKETLIFKHASVENRYY